MIHGTDHLRVLVACHGYESPTSRGLFGGYPSGCNRRRLDEEHAESASSWRAEPCRRGSTDLQGEEIALNAKPPLFDLGQDDAYEWGPQAGGGWGDPIEREAEQVVEDVGFDAVSEGAAPQHLRRGAQCPTARSTRRRRKACGRRTRRERLGWPQPKRMAKAVDARDGEVVAIYGDRADFVRVAGALYFRCGCGHVIAPAGENWKQFACQGVASAEDSGRGSRCTRTSSRRATPARAARGCSTWTCGLRPTNRFSMSSSSEEVVRWSETKHEVEAGWVTFRSGADEIRGYLGGSQGRREAAGDRHCAREPRRHSASAGGDAPLRRPGLRGDDGRPLQPDRRQAAVRLRAPQSGGAPQRRVPGGAGRAVGPRPRRCAALSRDAPEVDAARIGTLGYCLGGGPSLVWATQSADLKACVILYALPILPPHYSPENKPRSRIDIAAAVRCPVQCHFGENDEVIPLDQVRSLDAALHKSGRPVELYTYAGAGHAFEDAGHPNHHAAAARQVFDRSVAFFRKYL